MIAAGQKEPELVLHDRSADGAVGLPQLLQLARFTQSRRDQPGVEVAALHRAVGAAGEPRAADLVATGLGHHVDHRPAGLGLTQPASDVDRHFGGIRRVGHIERPAAARPVDAQAIDVETAFGRRAAVTAHVQRRRAVDPADVLARRVEAGHEHDQVVIVARARYGTEGVAADHPLLLGALHVDDRALALDRHGLFK